MSKILLNKYVWIVNAISVMVAFLTHFPELIALFSLSDAEPVFPGMHWGDVWNEVFFTYVSLLLLFFVNKTNKQTTLQATPENKESDHFY